MRIRTIVLYVFVVLSLGGAFINTLMIQANIEKDKINLSSSEVLNTPDLSYFKGIQYYLVEDHENKLFLDAFEIVFDERTDDLAFSGPNGFYFLKKDSFLHFESFRGHYMGKKGTLELTQEVKLESSNSKFTADHAIYDSKKNNLRMDTNVKMIATNLVNGDELLLNSNKMFFDIPSQLAKADGNVDGKIHKSRVYHRGLDFKTNHLSADLSKNLISLVDSVEVLYGPVKATSRNGNIIMGNFNKKLKYLTMTDDVRISEYVHSGGEKILREAYAEKLEMFAKEKKVVLTGYPKVVQGSSRIKGNRIILREDIEVVEVENVNTNITIK